MVRYHECLTLTIQVFMYGLSALSMVTRLGGDAPGVRGAGDLEAVGDVYAGRLAAGSAAAGAAARLAVTSSPSALATTLAVTTDTLR
jgi:hypothetical protein